MNEKTERLYSFGGLIYRLWTEREQRKGQKEREEMNDL